jgi:hypothetical protein
MTSTPAASAAPDAFPPPASLPRRLLRLCLALGALLLIMYVIAPFLVENIPAFNKYAQTVERTGIIPGALYYTDVPQSTDAEMNNRDAVRFLAPGKGKEEAKRKEEKYK